MSFQLFIDLKCIEKLGIEILEYCTVINFVNHSMILTVGDHCIPIELRFLASALNGGGNCCATLDI